MTKPKPPQMRTFRVAPGAPGDGDRVVIPPKGLLTGPGARAARFRSGETFQLPAETAACRFIRNRVRLGDLVEVTAPELAPARAVKEG
jgi:hypothetical protein